MSILRSTVLTSAIVGAGLVTSAGAAFAGDDPGATAHHGSSHHGSSHHGNPSHDHAGSDSSCFASGGTGSKHAEGAVALGNVLDVVPVGNLCHVLEGNGNGNGSGNDVALLGSNVGAPTLPGPTLPLP